MSTTTLTRLSGLALIAAFALTLTGGILHPVIGGDSHAVLAIDPATSALVGPGGAIPSSAPFAVLQEIGGLVYMLGLVVLGIAVFRSRVMPRWTGVLMAASPIFLLLPIPEAPVLSGLLIELPRGFAVAGMGYTLFARGDEEPTNTGDAELARRGESLLGGEVGAILL